MDSPAGRGRVLSVNVGTVRTVPWEGRLVSTGIFKQAAPGRHRIRGVNVDGDQQADRSAHGGTDKALYAYAQHDYRWWARQLGRELERGTFGENLTTQHLDLARAVVGERWQVGTAILRVTQPRIPCYKLGLRMGDRRFPARFAAAARPGAYLAIERDGDVGAGDPITVLSRPDHGLTVGDVERAYHADRRLPRLVDVPDLPEGWRDWARKQLAARTGSKPGSVMHGA